MTAPITYQVRLGRPGLGTAKLDVVGFEVGRLAVRKADPPMLSRNSQTGESFEVTAFVDHPPSNSSLYAAIDLDEAWAIADEVSRFAPGDLTAKTMQDLIEQLGPELSAWLRQGAPLNDYRRWKRESAQHPRAQA